MKLTINKKEHCLTVTLQVKVHQHHLANWKNCKQNIEKFTLCWETNKSFNDWVVL